MSRPEILVDERGRRIGDVQGDTIGIPGIATPRPRILWALPTNAPGGGAQRRYAPPWAPGETGTIALDFSLVIPVGTGIATATLSLASTDFVVDPVIFAERRVYATMSGGVAGTDYKLEWIVTTSQGDVIPRTTLLLCAPTS